VEICVRLPINYPLSNTNIECTHHIGFTKDQWNKWMLQLKTNLTQNVNKDKKENSNFCFFGYLERCYCGWIITLERKY
jgi:hypothetical protein